MERSRRIAVVAMLTLAITLGSLGVAWMAAGGGHGSYLPFAIFFPYGFLAADALGGGVGLIPSFLALVQFPVYGFVVGRAWTRERWRFGGVVLLAHVVLALICALRFSSA